MLLAPAIAGAVLARGGLVAVFGAELLSFAAAGWITLYAHIPAVQEEAGTANCERGAPGQAAGSSNGEGRQRDSDGDVVKRGRIGVWAEAGASWTFIAKHPGALQITTAFVFVAHWAHVYEKRGLLLH